MTAIIHLLEAADPQSQIGQAIFSLEQEADHVVELRAGQETRPMFSDKDEEALWRILSKLQFVLSSIAIGREAVRAAE